MRCNICGSFNITDAGYYSETNLVFDFSVHVCYDCGTLHKLDVHTRETTYVFKDNRAKCVDYGLDTIWEIK